MTSIIIMTALQEIFSVSFEYKCGLISIRPYYILFSKLYFMLNHANYN
jgi:hypothetical protein